jgi:U3 small nucleolar RNA-associated protein 4
LVWSVAVIAASAFIGSKAATTFDGDVIVSGDSMGLVKFWDAKTNTQIDSLQCHKTDILCLAIGPVSLCCSVLASKPRRKELTLRAFVEQDGKSVYSSGVDQTVSEVQFASVRQGFARSGKQDVGRWIHTHSRRLHAHDVRALTISPSYSALFPGPGNKTTSTSLAMSKVPVVISGGLDFSLVLTPAATSSTPATLLNPISDTKTLTFAASTQRKASYIPQRTSSLVSLAREVGIMVERTLQGLNLWSLKPIQAASSSSPPAISATAAAAEDKQPYQKLLEMELNTQTNLIASAISEDGQWLAASDLYETRLWRLKTAVSCFSLLFSKF